MAGTAVSSGRRNICCVFVWSWQEQSELLKQAQRSALHSPENDFWRHQRGVAWERQTRMATKIKSCSDFIIFSLLMNLLNKLQGGYDQLWQHIIRPARTTYPDSDLGPETFILENIKVKRNSFQLINDRGLVFYGSHFVPLEATSYPCVIYLHGNSSNQTEGMEYLGELIRHNISLCVFDFTGCGNSEGEYISLGYNEWKDVEEVYNYLQGKDKVTQIGLWGRSMGAVTALRYANKNSNIKVIVVDSPFKSLKTLIGDIGKKNSKIPAIILSGALKIIATTIKEKAGFDVYDLDPLKQDAPNIKTPGFFIVGEDDELIPPSHTQALFQAYKSKRKQIRIVKGEHNSNRPEVCIKEAVKFLNKYLNKQEKSKNEDKSANKEQQGEVDFFDLDMEEKKENNDVDFFADEPQGISRKVPSYKEIDEDIDFFGQQGAENSANMQDIDFASFNEQEFTAAQNSNGEKGGFSINELFSGIFSQGTTKTKKVKLNDGYENTRALIEQILGPQKKLAKSNEGHDRGLINLLQAHPEKYVW